MMLDIANFYLLTPLTEYEYFRIKLLPFQMESSNNTICMPYHTMTGRMQKLENEGAAYLKQEC